MASLWKLPVIFLCQNNGYGECTRYEDATAVAHVADRAASYDMRGRLRRRQRSDGDVARDRAMPSSARAAATGPTLLEANDFSLHGALLR